MRALTVMLGGAALLIACGGHRPVEIDPQAQAAGARWNATLATPAALSGAMNVRGRGWWGPEQGNPSRSRAQVDISNAVPKGQHPWHVHQGQCGSNGPIVGPAESYRPLEVDGDGKATATADLPVAMATSGQYYINVHASASNMGTIIACGNLAPPITGAAP
ncbi:MAG TPA: CHRD domain-containing protein [Gemmatimonadales bacterium]|nr:CHRD domain-containing protein [Gemmatimonadales bacterium]